MSVYYAFDFDGTLADSNDGYVVFCKQYFQKHGRQMPENFIRDTVVLSIEDTCKVFSQLLQISAEQVSKDIDAWIMQYYAEEVELKPFVREYLEQQIRKDVRMCILSSNTKKYLEKAIEHLDIGKYFERIITPEDTGGKSKGEKDIFLYASEQFGTIPANVVFFDDSLSALQTAASTGLQTVGVYDKAGAQKEDEIRKLCDHYIYSFEELLV